MFGTYASINTWAEQATEPPGLTKVLSITTENALGIPTSRSMSPTPPDVTTRAHPALPVATAVAVLIALNTKVAVMTAEAAAPVKPALVNPPKVGGVMKPLPTLPIMIDARMPPTTLNVPSAPEPLPPVIVSLYSPLEPPVPAAV